MTLFSFEALSRSGQTVRGRRAGESVAALRQELEREALTPVSIRPSRLSSLTVNPALNDAEAGRFACDLARYLRSGLSAAQALALLEETGATKVRRFAGRSRERILSGEPLSRAFGEAGGQSGRLLQTLAAAGEGSGRQADVLDTGGRSLLASAALKRRLVTLSLYPAFVLTVALAAVALYAFAVLPALEPAFGDLTGELPASTMLVIQGGKLLRTVLPIAGLLAVAAVTALIVSAKVRGEAREVAGRLLLSRWTGGLLADLVFAGFASRMSIALQAGVPLPSAYRTSIEAIGFRGLRRTLEAQDDRLRDGAALSQVLAAGRIAPADFVRLVQVGERSDDLGRILEEAGQMLAIRAQEKAERLLAAATPLVVVVIGVLVGGVTLMVFQGLLAVTNAVDV